MRPSMGAPPQRGFAREHTWKSNKKTEPFGGAALGSGVSLPVGELGEKGVMIELLECPLPLVGCAVALRGFDTSGSARLACHRMNKAGRTRPRR